jgi:C-terminal processing protease CtpA/Prc
LILLAHFWHVVSLHHPWIASRGIAWDSALIIATTRVRAATDDAALMAAFTRLTAILQDPLTRIETATTVEPSPVAIGSERTGDSVAVLRIAPAAPLDATDSVLIARTAEGLPARVLLDVRGASVSDPVARANKLDDFLVRTGLTEQLVGGVVMAPVERTRRIGVFARADDARELDAVGFRDGWQESAAATYRGRAPSTRRLLVLADSGTVLPGVLLALLDAGRASLVADGGLRDAAPVQRVRLPLAAGMIATIRVGELLHADGSLDVVADTTIARASTGDAALQAAMAMLRAPAPLPLSERPLWPIALPAVTPTFFDTTAYPFMGARLLSGFRLWSTMRARHAHRDLYDDDLDAVFARVLPRLEAATRAGEYAMAMSDLAASLDDTEGRLQGDAYEAVVGDAALPFRVRLAEGRAFITDVIRDSVTTAMQLVPGAEIVALDGFPTVAWLSEHRRIAPASNDWTRARALAEQMSRGQPGEVMVRVRDVNGRERALSVPRSTAYRVALPRVERPANAAARVLNEQVAYIDVERLSDATVDAAFATAASARGLVLDLRGRLTLDDERVLRHVATRPRALVGRIVQRTLATPCLLPIREAVLDCPDVRESRSWWRAIDTAAVYAGRVVVLIDERTQGAMERLALSLEQMATITFVGSASAGAVSPVTPLSLPGGLTAGIAVREIRRADGGQVQRVGLTPAIDVRASARGLRSGEDEVLARAQQWLTQQLEPPRRRR